MPTIRLVGVAKPNILVVIRLFGNRFPEFEFISHRHPNLGLSILDDVREMPEVAGHCEEVSPGSSSTCYGAIARYPDPRKLRRWSATDSAHHIAHFLLGNRHLLRHEGDAIGQLSELVLVR